MPEIIDLAIKRKEAYEYIRRKLWNFSSSWEINSDKTLASALDVSLEELVSLKEGRANPTPRLIKGVRTFFEKEVTEDEIEKYFINPFK